MIIPTIGRIVLYCLSQSDVARIRANRHVNNDFISNDVNEGDVYPAMVTRVFSDNMINLKVMLDGNDTFWATSRSVSDDAQPGYFHWMPYQKQQAAVIETPAPASLEALLTEQPPAPDA